VLVQRLLSFAIDGNVSDPVALQAIHDALDRAGMKPGIDVDVTLKPYQTIFEAMESGSRSSFRGESVTEAIEANDDNHHALELEPYEPFDDDLVVDVDVVDQMTPEDDERGSVGYSAPEPSPFAPKTPPPEAGMMSYDAAVSAAGAMRRNAQVRTAQRALPPGRVR
jgi:hypothetical protein